MILRGVLAWFPMVLIAIGNGLVRVHLFEGRMSELAAHQLSTLLGLLLFGIYIFAFTAIWPIQSARQAWTTGLIWLAMTMTFEFLFGHYIVGHPWSRLFHDYNLAAGRVWILVLIWTTVAPYVFFRLRAVPPSP